MARGSRRGRVSIRNTRSPLPLNFNSSYFPTSWTLQPLQSFEDRRAWHPLGQAAPARSFSQTRHRLTIPAKSRFFPGPRLSNVVGFVNPQRILICVRRRIRREVIHALRFAGRGRGKQRPPRRSEYSSIHC